MAFLPEGMADDIANADVFARGERARDGEYVFLHVACTYEKTRRGPALIIEHEVVEAKKVLPDVEPNPVGSKVTYFMPDYGDAAVMLQPNMKNYVCGLAGHDPKSVDKGIIKELIKKVGGPEQIGRGMLIKATTFHTEKRNDGEDFMGFNWYPMPGQNVPNAPDVLTRRAALDAKKAGQRPSNGAQAAAQPPQAPSAAAPSIPTAPAIPTAPSLPAAIDPVQVLLSQGWAVHPGDANYLWKGQEVKKKEDLIAALPR